MLQSAISFAISFGSELFFKFWEKVSFWEAIKNNSFEIADLMPRFPISSF